MGQGRGRDGPVSLPRSSSPEEPREPATGRGALPPPGQPRAWIPLKKRRANLAVSLSPIRMIAAFVFPPYPSPSQKPAPSATTFFSAPQSSTPATSLILPSARSTNASRKAPHS